MPSKYIKSCVFILSLLLITFGIIGITLYINHCDTYFGNECHTPNVDCEIKSHYIYSLYCSNDDDYIYFNNDDNDNNPNICHELMINCKNINYSCNAGYFSSYQNAENYFYNNYYYNESLTAYVVDSNNQTCIVKNPNSISIATIIGFYSIVLSIIILFIIISIIFSYHIKNKKNNYQTIPEYKINNEPPPYF